VNTTLRECRSTADDRAFYSVKVKGFGGFSHNVTAPFGSNPNPLDPTSCSLVELLAKPVSLAMRLLAHVRRQLVSC